MNNNVVIAVFDVESEAFQAFSGLRQATYGEGYDVYEAGIIKVENGVANLMDGFSYAPANADTSTGVIIGSFVGILGGPIGVMLGASVGALAGTSSDLARAADNASAIAVVAGKIYEGETAIVALVSEDEPAFDKVFADYATTIMRYDAADIAADVDRLYELQGEISNQVIEKLRADHEKEVKAELEASREEHRAQIAALMEAQDKVISETNKITRNLRPI